MLKSYLLFYTLVFLLLVTSVNSYFLLIIPVFIDCLFFLFKCDTTTTILGKEMVISTEKGIGESSSISGLIYWENHESVSSCTIYGLKHKADRAIYFWVTTSLGEELF